MRLCCSRFSAVSTMLLLVGKRSDLISFHPTPNNLKTNPDFAKTQTNKLNFHWKKKEVIILPVLHFVQMTAHPPNSPLPQETNVLVVWRTVFEIRT